MSGTPACGSSPRNRLVSLIKLDMFVGFSVVYRWRSIQGDAGLRTENALHTLHLFCVYCICSSRREFHWKIRSGLNVRTYLLVAVLFCPRCLNISGKKNELLSSLDVGWRGRKGRFFPPPCTSKAFLVQAHSRSAPRSSTGLAAHLPGTQHKCRGNSGESHVLGLLPLRKYVRTRCRDR